MLYLCYALLIAAVIALVGVVVFVIVSMICEIYLTATGPMYFRRKSSRATGEKVSKIKEMMEEEIQELTQHCAEDDVAMRILPISLVRKRDALAVSTSIKELNLISYSAVWIELLTSGIEAWKIAFRLSIGHEMSHRSDIKKEKGFFFQKKVNKRLFNWLKEIRNDLNGVRFVLKHYDNVTKAQIIEAARIKGQKYEADAKRRFRRKKKISNSHPSWKTRIHLMENYDEITHDLIHFVASIAGCKDPQYIRKMEKLYLSK